jgi:ABC-2 type transport system permease protein
MRARKVKAVASFEFFSEIKRIGYLIGVFGMPVFLLAYGGLISLVTFIAKKNESEVKIHGVVDQATVLQLKEDHAQAPVELPREIKAALQAQKLPMMSGLAWWENIVFRPFADEAAALAALQDKSIKSYFLIPHDYVQTGKVDIYVAETTTLGGQESERALRNLLQERLMLGKVSEEIAARIRTPMQKGKEWTVKASGERTARNIISVIARFAVPLAFAVLMFVSVFVTATALINGTAVEKENRVVDVLLSSANPEEIMAGKLLGLAGTGLLQVTIWFGMFGVGGLMFAGALSAAGVEIPWSAIGLGVVFFVAGYLFLGSLMLGTGALGSTAKEGQQWNIVWVMITIVPMIFIESFIREPHGMLAQVLTWIPFSTAMLVVFRTAIDPGGIAWWEVLGALLVMLVSIRLALRLGAKLYRIGLLLPSGRAKLGDILRQARL